MADCAAEVPLVDAIELVRGSEVHFLYDVVYALAASETSLDFFHSRILYCHAERRAAYLRKPELRKLARASEVRGNVGRGEFACAVLCDKCLRHVDEPRG